MAKYLLTALMFIVLPGVAWAQKTCTFVSQTSQNCLATLTWVIPALDPTKNEVAPMSYQIRRSDAGGAMTIIGTINAPALTMQNSFTDAGNVNHCWDVVSVAIIDGKSVTATKPSPQACWTTPAMAPPTVAPVTGLTLSAISSSTIRISWADNNDPPNNETGTEIQAKRATGQPYSLVATVGPDVTTWDYTGRQSYKTYCARVRAMNGNITSGWTPASCATTSKR